MTTQELKHKIIEKVNQLQDEDLLNDLIRIIDDTADDDKIYRLSEKHKKAVTDAVKEIEKGNYLTGEQSNMQANEWLNK